MRKLIAITLILLAAAACQSTPRTKVENSSSLDIAAAPRGKTYTEWGEYIIDSNDMINIQIQDQPAMSSQQRVSPSGFLAFPTIGMVRARGMTEVALRESLVLKLRPHVKIPRVSVSVIQMNSFTIYFEGRVSKPGTYKLESRTTLQQGLALAGGITGDSDGRIILVRDTPEGVRKRFETSLAKLRSGLPVLDNLLLERGDLIIVE